MSKKFITIMLLSAIIVLALIACGESTSTTSITPTTQAAQVTAAPTHALKWATTHSFSGNGAKKTAIFSVPGDWKINWSCDNTGQNYGVDGVIYISVYGSDSMPIDLNAASGTCKADKITRDSTEEHESGQVYLDINASLPWTIQIQELK